jgi:hypothetical protein
MTVDRYKSVLNGETMSQKPLKGALLGLCVVIVGAASVWSLDHFTVRAPDVVMIGDADVTVEVTPVQEGSDAAAPQKVKFSALPAGVSLEPTVPAHLTQIEGPTRYRLVTSPTAAAGPMSIRLQRSGNAKVSGAAFLRLEKTLSSLELSPAGASAPRLGEPVLIQVLAKDADGAVVTSYRDTVVLSASLGSVTPATVPGSAFKDGLARVEVVFDARDPQTGGNRLTVRTQKTYPGRTTPATGSIDLQLRGSR